MARTAILIDDDSDDLAIIKEIISNVDPSMVCISFIYPDEAMRVLLNQELIVIPDVIFIDINMPGLTGDKCLKALRSDKYFKEVFVAIYSTSMPEEVSDALKRLGANVTFEKPVRMGRYTEIISQILDEVKVLR